MNDQQRLYADALLSGAKPKAARVQYGLPANYPVENYNPAVKEYIGKARARLEEEAHISRSEVLNGFKRAIDDATLAGDPANQIAGWREIGKMLGYYEPSQVKLQLTVGQERALSRLQVLSDHELIQLATTEWEKVDE